MGAHTVADLVVGLLLGGLLMLGYLLIGDVVDTWLATSYLVPIVVPAIPIVLVWLYPASKTWSESYGDTATFLGMWHVVSAARLTCYTKLLEQVLSLVIGLLVHPHWKRD